MTFIMDSAVAFLLSLPLMVVALNSHKKNAVWKGIWFGNFLLIGYMMNYGELFWVVCFWQILFILPMSTGVYWLQSGKFKLSELDRKHLSFIIVMSVLCLVVIAVGTLGNNREVKNLHVQLMTELASSEEPLEILMYESYNPSSLLSILPDIEEIQEGEISVFSLPWKSTVSVVTGNEKEQIKLDFTYVRFYEGWKLEGHFSSTGIVRY